MIEVSILQFLIKIVFNFEAGARLLYWNLFTVTTNKRLLCLQIHQVESLCAFDQLHKHYRKEKF